MIILLNQKSRIFFIFAEKFRKKESKIPKKQFYLDIFYLNPKQFGIIPNFNIRNPDFHKNLDIIKVRHLGTAALIDFYLW